MFRIDDLRLVQAAQRRVEAFRVKRGVAGRGAVAVGTVEVRQQPPRGGVLRRLGVTRLHPGYLFEFVGRRGGLTSLEHPDDRADEVAEQCGLVQRQCGPEAGTAVGFNPLPLVHGEVRFPSS